LFRYWNVLTSGALIAGYQDFMVEERIVIVEPDTRKIGAVVSRALAEQATGNASRVPRLGRASTQL
jgi:hypothetical protein